jgi:hypothetical protein
MLRDLGVLSFVNTGLFIAVYGIGMLASVAIAAMPYDQYEAMMRTQLELLAGGEDMEPMMEMLALYHAHGTALMGLMLLRTLARLVGVLGLWNGRAWGFHVYAVAQLGGIFLPHLVLPLKFLGLGGALCAIGMTALYGTQRKYLV